MADRKLKPVQLPALDLRLVELNDVFWFTHLDLRLIELNDVFWFTPLGLRLVELNDVFLVYTSGSAVN